MYLKQLLKDKNRIHIKEICFNRYLYLFFTIFYLLFILNYPVSARHRHHKKRGNNKAKEPVIRVKLGKLHKKIIITFPHGGYMKNSKGRIRKRFRKNRSFEWHAPDKRHKRRFKYKNQTMYFEPKKSYFILNGKPYHGKLAITFKPNGALTVNHLNIENYVKGVVSLEIGSKAPLESLKAQAVIARTYAYANKNRHGKDGADVCDSTHCQVYGGIKAERKTTNEAVNATKGIIMVSNNKPISSLYHATCGGMTSDNEKVFGGKPRSYLRRVICPFCKHGVNYRWKRFIKTDDLRKKLARINVNYNWLYDINYTSDGHFDRVNYVILKTNKGDLKVKGTTFRRIFNLPSTTFLIAPAFKINFVSPQKAFPNTNKKQESQKNNSIRNGKNTLQIVRLGTKQEPGPKQLAVYSYKGLQRVKQPKRGWQVIIYRKSATNTNNKQTNNRNKTKELTPKYSSADKIEQIIRISAKPYERRKGLKQIEIYGRGYGHQVGLCQSGAIEMGKKHWSYRQILPYYYSNVALRHLKY